MYYADRFRDALKNGGRALFVGIGTEQLPEDYRGDPRLICWDSDSAEVKRITGLPARTRVVVMTRFIRHGTSDRIQKLTRNTNILLFGKLNGTGEIARMLREALPMHDAETATSSTPFSALGPVRMNGTHGSVDLPPEPSRPPTPPPLPPPDGFKTITDCVRHFAAAELNRPLDAGRQKHPPLPDAYYAELLAKARDFGFESDDDRIRAIFSNVRTHMRRQREASTARPEPSAPVITAAPVAAAPESVAPLVLEPLPPDLDALVQMADDLDLKAIQASDLADHLRRIVAEQRQLRECKVKLDAILAIGNTIGTVITRTTSGNGSSVETH